MNYLIFVGILLSAIAFFNPHGIFSDQLQKFMFLAASAAGLVYVSFKGKSTEGQDIPWRPYIVMLACILISAFMASAFHSQSLKTSFIVILPTLFAYGFFYILVRLDLSEKTIIRTLIFFLAASTFVFFCNFLTFPQNIFGRPILNEDLSRGMLRIPLVFIEMYPLLLFYAINQWNVSRKKIWFVLMVWMTLMIFMSVVRQCIFFSGVLGFFFFFKRLSTALKLGLIALFAAIVLFVLPMIPAYSTMMELSESQMEGNEDVEDIRIQAWRYYTYENQTNFLSPFFGNGVPSYGNSVWGTMCEGENIVSGRFAEDVGWAGFFWYYGGIATACLIILLIKAFRRKKKETSIYLNYWILYLMITAVASGPILYYHKVILVMLVTYLCFCPTTGIEQQDEKDGDAPEDSKPKTWWDALPKLPQLNSKQ